MAIELESADAGHDGTLHGLEPNGIHLPTEVADK